MRALFPGVAFIIDRWLESLYGILAILKIAFPLHEESDDAAARKLLGIHVRSVGALFPLSRYYSPAGEGGCGGLRRGAERGPTDGPYRREDTEEDRHLRWLSLRREPWAKTGAFRGRIVSFHWENAAPPFAAEGTTGWRLAERKSGRNSRHNYPTHTAPGFLQRRDTGTRNFQPADSKGREGASSSGLFAAAGLCQTSARYRGARRRHDITIHTRGQRPVFGVVCSAAGFIPRCKNVPPPV
ncbi:unnamed protein product [Amoebophrya sp. A25]|nr:unnamed protein product [Amoebophrya sp. A25]|eukprot:GSA25T00002516001.1